MLVPILSKNSRFRLELTSIRPSTQVQYLGYNRFKNGTK
jgi:hypothetical protein